MCSISKLTHANIQQHSLSILLPTLSTNLYWDQQMVQVEQDYLCSWWSIVNWNKWQKLILNSMLELKPQTKETYWFFINSAWSGCACNRLFNSSIALNNAKNIQYLVNLHSNSSLRIICSNLHSSKPMKTLSSEKQWKKWIYQESILFVDGNIEIYLLQNIWTDISDSETR